MVMSIVRASDNRPTIEMEEDIGRATMLLREFLFEHVYRNPVAKSEEGKAKDMLMYMFDYYVKNPDKLPDIFRRRADTDPPERRVCDFIAGMTDRYAIEVYSDLCIPKVWRGPQ